MKLWSAGGCRREVCAKSSYGPTGRRADMGTRGRRSRVSVVMVAVGACPVGCSAQAADGMSCPVRHN
eukprot:5457654-Amphidinium_carterae.2